MDTLDCSVHGDHDPSGKNIEDDIRWKLKTETRLDIDWKRIAATKEDIEKYKQYLLPLKAGDTRTSGYLKQYGPYGIEVDAVDTAELISRLRNAIEKQIDHEAWSKALKAEEAQQRDIQKRIDLD